MIYPLNEFKVDVACLGNHDFDYELPVVEDLIKKS
jgi:2',3'-cyclic-nucleotide 2'-phosphodiesterase (5'-nucleotidase family)